MAAPSAITGLVRRFQEHHGVYTSGAYNETQLRREFLDPFFEALGWDVFNKQGFAEAYKDVIHEDAIKVGAFTKAPDYCFRVGGTRKFFVEAKKPSVNVKDDLAPAFQVRRYAWSAKLPLSILTDFEEFAVYDCRVKPDKADKASTARIMYLTYTEFEKRWDEIAAIFSKDAVLKGSFDKYAQAIKGKKGTAEVDAAFLQEIEGWREVLARNIALRNSQLSQRELNFAVQQTIDRIIFLRICEDRGMEAEGRLAAATNGANVYKRLCELFRLADNKYNSGLFHFRKEQERGLPDEMTLGLEIDDKPLKDIIKNLYYPDCPYEFSVISSDILGQVYEQFLGKVIRLTDGHRAVIEDKPEVKKAGGVYYTPTYIVDYIVKNTVGKLLGDQGSGVGVVGARSSRPKAVERVQAPAGDAQQNFAQSKITTKEASQLRILDPACGSGSFLIGAYQHLLDWHLEWYAANNPQKNATGKNPALYQGNSGDWKLTLGERKRILLDNIYGVDIDPQAVEVTKLSLLLKVLEGESEQSTSGKQKLLHTRVLPDLDRNIKCGNSLIGPDFYAGRQTSLFNDEERLRINVFDWKAEFPEIMKAGGFDAVIGNPPWGAIFSKLEQNFLSDVYEAARGKNIDSYAIFTECALIQLIRPHGLLSFIIPDTFLRKDDYLSLRKIFFLKSNILELIETGPVFSQVRDTWCLVFNLSNSKPNPNNKIRHTKISRFIVSAEERLRKFGQNDWDMETEVSQDVWQQRPMLIIGYSASVSEQNVIAKIEMQPKLGETDGRYFISRGEEGSKFALEEKCDGNLLMVIPKDVYRYSIDAGLRIGEELITKEKLEHIYRHPKIWIIRIQKLRWQQRIVCCLDDRTNSAGMKTLQTIVSKTDDIQELKYLQGILASRLINFWCVNYLADDMNKSYLQKLPIRTIDFSDPADKARHDRMVEMVEQMLALNKQLAITNTAHEKTALQRQIDATDHQIDQLVYELYGLTEEEIKIVEGA